MYILPWKGVNFEGQSSHPISYFEFSAVQCPGCGRQGSRAAGQPVVRKVRTAQGTVLDNVKAEQSDGKCNRKIPQEEMQKFECRMQNEKKRRPILPSFWILHSSFCISSCKGEMVR